MNAFGSKTDSLFKAFKNQKVDTNRIKTLFSLARTYKSVNTDSSLYFLNIILEDAIKLKSLKSVAKCYFEMGDIYENIGKYEMAIKTLEKSLEKALQLNDLLIPDIYSRIGICEDLIGHYKHAIVNYNKALKIYQDKHDSTGLRRVYNNIGLVFLNMKDYDKTIVYYNKSLDIKKRQNDMSGILKSYNNLGVVYYHKGDFDKAYKFFKLACEIAEMIKSDEDIARGYNNVGGVLKEKGNLAKALEYYEKSIEIRKKIFDTYGLAATYGNVGEIHFRQHNYQKAKEFYLLSLKLSKELKVVDLQINALFNLIDTYEHFGNIPEAFRLQKEYILLKDSLYKKETLEQISELTNKLESEKKELEITGLNQTKLLQQIEISEKEGKIKIQHIIIWVFIVGLILFSVLLFLILKQYRQKKKAFVILENQNAIINQRNEEISSQRYQILEQKNEIEQIQLELTDSIIYASNIQSAVLPHDNYIKEFFPEYFILFKPKNIVSGDFVWFSKTKQWVLFCVADCTGHGVPGAFMSMLGIALLNEIVRREEITQANQVLVELRKRVIESLQQKNIYSSEINFVRDGMDMAFCAFNQETLELQFAGANNPIWIIRAVSSDTERSRSAEMTELVEPVIELVCREPAELIEIKGDNMTVSIGTKMHPFTNHCIQLQKGDLIYLSSDGYSDQYGGPKRKKFLSKNLKHHLIENRKRTMNEQKEILENILFSWMGIHEQIDDITILGIKI